MYPRTRLRRNRKSEWVRNLVRETELSVKDIVLPLFVQEGSNKATPVDSMPGVKRYSIDLLLKKVLEAKDLGIPAVALFPVIDQSLKNETASEALNDNSLICRAVKEIKSKIPDIGVICDIALDPYTSHGQDGIVKGRQILNDETVAVLAKQAVILAEAGADIVAPSDMMDGRVGEIREALDINGYESVSILSYSAKYASSFYGPFRDAVGSTTNLGKGSKETYQMDPANVDEALREVELDVLEGADMVMVKPGLPYLDIISRVKQEFNIPIFAYQVSGEYAMIKAASNNGWLDEDKTMFESILSLKRAGASVILTYYAVDLAKKLQCKK